ncbi:MAG: DUF1446 domain-containing protein [Firmicutes bacterium]|nr:DUF1446 domain-containing protein [Bacillota bacterium]
MDEIRVLSPTAILGYGFPVASFEEGLRREPHVIAVDGGSTDPGPYYLGAGKSFTQRQAVKRDLELLIKAALDRRIPLIIGTAGGSGARPHVEWTWEIVEDILNETRQSASVAVIFSDVPKALIVEMIKQGRTSTCGPLEGLTPEVVAAASHVVAQMGVEPFIKALQAGADIILAGRAYDPAAFAALPIMRGFDAGLALHMGKILECAAIAAVPGSGSDCLFGRLQKDSFILEALNPARQCTEMSVAAHTLYEKSDPYLLPGPGGTLDLNSTKFRALPGGRVEVSGTRLVPTPTFTVKLEGARAIGFRTISIAGVRDPIMIDQIDSILAAVRQRVQDNFAELKDYFLQFRCYGKNGVMGDLEPTPNPGHELGIVIECVAESQEVANTICGFARSTLLHHGYPGRKSTAGNLAFPYSPSDFPAGEVFEFCVHHLMELDDPAEIFSMEWRVVK